MKLSHETGDGSQARLLTIVIPAYRHEAYVEECLRSIDEAKNAGLIDLIVIDDGSPDRTLETVIGYPFGDALHVRVFSKANSGLVDSLAKGLALASTPYVAFIASDDYYVTSGLDHMVEELRSATGNDLCWVCQASYLEDRDGEPVYGPAMARAIGLLPEARLKALSMEYPRPLLLQSSIFSVKLLRSVNPWGGPVELDDWPTFVKIADRATREPVDFRYLPSPLFMRYRMHEGGVHNDTARQLRICLQVVDNVVRPEFRREATARVYINIGLIHLYQRRFGNAAELFWRALKTFPSPRIAARIPVRLTKAVWKRLDQKLRPKPAKSPHV